MKRKAAKRKPVKKLAPKVPHKLGDKHFIEGIDCVTKFVNNNVAYIFPTIDDPDYPQVASHIAYAKIDGNGDVTMI